MIGLEHIVKVYNGTYTKLAEKMGLVPSTVMGWLSKKRPIPKAKLEMLSEMFGIEEEFFTKKLSETEKIQIEIDYLNKVKEKLIADNKRENIEIDILTLRIKIKLIEEQGSWDRFIYSKLCEILDPES